MAENAADATHIHPADLCPTCHSNRSGGAAAPAAEDHSGQTWSALRELLGFADSPASQRA